MTYDANAKHSRPDQRHEMENSHWTARTDDGETGAVPARGLTKAERTLINVRANELARRAYTIYKWRLCEWAAARKARNAQPVTVQDLAALDIHIPDELLEDDSPADA
jgi:hypothetical protein